MAPTWKPHNGCAPMPFNAVRAGQNCDGSPIYVGRTIQDGRMMPAKVVPSKGGAYVGNNRKEYFKTEFDILIGPGYHWVWAHNGCVPPNSVVGGVSDSGRPLYIGRVMYKNNLCVGKINTTHGCLYIPFEGTEISIKTYEVLVCQEEDKWVQTCSGNAFPGALIAGHRACDHAPIYVARAMHNGQMIPGKFIPSKGGAYIAYDGAEHHKETCELLVGDGYHWVSQHNDCIPANAVTVGGSSCSCEPLLIGRAYYEGSMTPGAVSMSERCLLIPYFGREVRVPHYEILCRY